MTRAKKGREGDLTRHSKRRSGEKVWVTLTQDARQVRHSDEEKQKARKLRAGLLSEEGWCEKNSSREKNGKHIAE
jgi:flagellar biosynthesis regulator FlaF